MNSKMRVAFGQLSASGALVVVLVGYLMIRQPMLAEDVKTGQQVAATQQQQLDLQQQQIDANTSALADANGQLIALGKAPVPVPKIVPTTPPPQPDGLNAEESAAVRLIVADQIARTPAKVTQAEINQIARVAAALIPKPKDGKTPTAAELKPAISAALDAFCAQDRCVGKPGIEGKQGTEGPAGKDAPEVTDEQLLAAAQQALAAYCAAESKPCQGPAGKDAAAPYSVVDQDCVGDGEASYWKTYLSNGTDQKVVTAEGPCRIGPDPN